MYKICIPVNNNRTKICVAIIVSVKFWILNYSHSIYGIIVILYQHRGTGDRASSVLRDILTTSWPNGVKMHEMYISVNETSSIIMNKKEQLKTIILRSLFRPSKVGKLITHINHMYYVCIWTVVVHLADVLCISSILFHILCLVIWEYAFICLYDRNLIVRFIRRWHKR